MKDGLGEMRRRACERGGSLLLWAAPAPCVFSCCFLGVACVYVRVTSTRRPVPGQLLKGCVIYNQ